ncbi:phosphatidylserine decarboxylase family protein [Desulfamplus magnetovallimortis]|uniref:phosphatidylserine decarboxylase family protein n=1 Tax=Desulfamplus magnetovallimortis TaxID=1246637 RepID=UPI001FE4C5A8|nr:phosphatidylserine decarboxylase family protein [Desulfamplus magnetovallimortis]
MALTLFVCWFFRDPEREIPDDPEAIVSPADGRVIIVEKVESSEFIDEPVIKLSIFMNVFNVHVNRIPFSGEVQKVVYIPGKFVNASFDKASEDNERNALVIKTDSGLCYGVVQIAGLIARRIVCSVKTGDLMLKGKRYGMICFGSRLDLYLPLETRVEVNVGEKVKAGSTVLGYFRS